MSDVPNGKTLAKCFKIDEDNKYTLNQRVCALRTNDLDLDFFLIQINRNQYFLNFDNGENQTNLRKNDILECPIFIPPIDEQLAIVSKLNQTLGFIEQSNSILEKNLSNLEELKKSILEKAFKGELV
ncbi:restriction endonuclease subunit S [Flavobacterium haoranii]|nr:restriction endonuclease subunit S [Flavobacterium haoranii]